MWNEILGNIKVIRLKKKKNVLMFYSEMLIQMILLICTILGFYFLKCAGF